MPIPFSAADSKNQAKTVPLQTTTSKGKTKDKRGTSAESQNQEKQEVANPLLEETESPINPWEPWISGNRVLIMLNLAGNKITKIGCAKLLNGLQKQWGIVEFKPGGGNGILHCSLQVSFRNVFFLRNCIILIFC